MQAQIITIGDEILIGQIVDTNAAYISRALNSAGVVVTERRSIGDDRERIIEALDSSLAQCDLVIMTGGLGPTKDDITKRTLADYFGMKLVRDEAVYEHVRKMLTARGIEFNELNQSQADVPDRCTVLHNAHGTAPAMWLEREGKVVVSLPGVPFEMEHLMQDEVLPRLRAQFALKQVVHRTMITSGLAESMLAKRIEEWEDALPQYIKLAYLPAPSQVRLRLSAYEVDGVKVGDEIDRLFAELEELSPQ
jgi:nicotinamide-nucleotide amidase